MVMILIRKKKPTGNVSNTVLAILWGVLGKSGDGGLVGKSKALKTRLVLGHFLALCTLSTKKKASSTTRSYGHDALPKSMGGQMTPM